MKLGRQFGRVGPFQWHTANALDGRSVLCFRLGHLYFYPHHGFFWLPLSESTRVGGTFRTMVRWDGGGK